MNDYILYLAEKYGIPVEEIEKDLKHEGRYK